MKKVLTFTLLFICFLSSGQKRSRGDLENIIYVGYSSFWYSDNLVKKSGAIESVNFGLLGDYYFNEMWSFRTGFTYQGMGGDNLSYGSEFSSDGTEKLGYINIPLNANWHFGTDKSFSLNFGFTPSFLVNNKGIYPGLGLTDVEIRPKTYRFQVGANAGIGYKTPLSDHISLLLDYQIFIGMTNISKVTGTSLMNVGNNINLGCVFGM